MGGEMAKSRVKGAAGRSVVVLFTTDEALSSGAQLLKSRTTAQVIRVAPAMKEPTDRGNIIRVEDITELRAWLRSVQQRPTTFLLALTADFDLHQQMMASLGSMRVQLPHVLSSGQDQIFILDQDQRMVAFFGRWPKTSPWRPEDMLGKRKSDLFGSDGAAVHDAAALRALKGEETAYEWTVTDAPRPVHLFTAASPLRGDDGEIVGVLLVTRNVTPVKQAQLEIEQALEEKTNQLLEVERGVRRVCGGLARPRATWWSTRRRQDFTPARFCRSVSDRCSTFFAAAHEPDRSRRRWASASKRCGVT
jgi:PAS domain S-box-containing protein